MQCAQFSPELDDMRKKVRMFIFHSLTMFQSQIEVETAAEQQVNTKTTCPTGLHVGTILD